jgi:DNA-binding transcriptional LysR family regulator
MSVAARGWKMHNARSGKSAEVQLRPHLACNDHLLLRDAALAGAGIALLPSFLGEQHVRQGELERVLGGWCIESADLSLLWPATLHTSPRVRAFVDATAAFFDPPPWARD